MIIQGSPDILRGPRGLNGQFGDVPAGMSDDEYYGKINAYVQSLAVSGLSPEAAQARLLQDMAALNVTVQDLHYATSMAPTEIKSLMSIDPGLVVTTAQGTAVAKDIVYSPAPTFYACSPGFAWDGEMCRATGLADPSTFGPTITADEPNLRPMSYTQLQISDAIRIAKQTSSDADVITGLIRHGLTSEEAVAALDKFYVTPPRYGTSTSTTGGGINPALILAAAAAAFFIGG